MNWSLLQNSLLVSAATTLGAGLLGFLSALWLAGLSNRWRLRWLVVAVVALALPPFLVTDCWIHWLGKAGVWRSWVPGSIYSPGGVVLLLTLMFWPITLFAVLGAWRRLEPSQFESEPALRGGALLRWLLWPSARAAVGQAAVLTLVLALNNFAVPAILQVKVYPAELWVSFNTTFDYRAALQCSWPLALAPLLLLAFLYRREVSWPRQAGVVTASLFQRQLGVAWWIAGGLAAIGAGLFSVGLPLLQLAGSAVTWRELPIAMTTAAAAAAHSFGFAVTTATVCCVLALGGCRPATGITDAPETSWRRATFHLAGCGWLWWLPFLMPGVLLGIALIFLLNRPPFVAFYQSAGVVVLALTLRYLAVSWTSVSQARQTVDRDLLEAARLEGASAWQRFRLVYGPQLAGPLAAAWYVTYLLCLWDVETIVLIVPPGGETLASRIFNLLHYGHNPQVNALCLLLLALAVLPLVAWQAARRWHGVSASET